MAIIEDVNGVLSRINDMDLHIRIVKGTESKSIKYDSDPEIEINWAVANDWDGIPEEIGFWIIFTKDWVFDDTQKFYDVIFNTVRGNLNLRRWIKLEPIYSNEHLLEGKFYIVAIVADVLMNDEVRRQAVENSQ
ncbi:MAG: hypothetical protein F4Z81_14430 [Gemmatimonadetes bacterium]|nr:hypothetical protein [Gemmatimonadota bacterium]MYB60105.1 hypothetical protein [Gemmatimonadota bacterium]